MYSSATAQWPLYGHRQGMFWDSWIGTEITNEDDVFGANTACSSEAFLIHDGVGLAGFEQNLIIGEKGVEILTKVWRFLPRRRCCFGDSQSC